MDSGRAHTKTLRILIEIALIKLCCPEMEATEDSVLPRVRKLEERLEKGSFSEDKEEPLPKDEIVPEEKPKQVISPAAPEDVKRVALEFSRVLEKLPFDERVSAKSAVASANEKGELELAFTERIKYDRFSRREEETSLRSFDDLQAAVNEVAGRAVTIVLKFKGDQVRTAAW